MPVWQTAITWLRRQKRRGRRHEKKYLPHRIRQEKHQLSRVMSNPRAGGRLGDGRRGGPAGCARARSWGEGEEGKRPSPGSRARVAPPLAGAAGPGTRRAAPTWLHLPGTPGRGLPPAAGSALPRGAARRCFSGGLGGGRGAPATFEARGAARERRWGPGRGGAGRGSACGKRRRTRGRGRRRQHCAPRCSECVSVRVCVCVDSLQIALQSHIAPQSIM